jgi:hypothetical protein
MEQQEKLLTSIVVKLTKFRRPRQLRQGTIDRKGRNTICGCGSKKKYKKCCWSKGNAPGTAFQSHCSLKSLRSKQSTHRRNIRADQ